jgi:hypothetical protein
MNFLASSGLGAQVFGSITLSGLALAFGTALILGVRGSDRIRINTKEKVGWTAIATGTLMVAAGGTMANIALGIGGAPTSVIGHSGIGNIGQGGVAMFLTLLVFGPKWRKLVYPALLGIAAAVVYGTAGGIWEIGTNGFRMAIGHMTGSA